MRPGFSLRVLARDGNARVTEYVTPHAVVETPAFMPVGTVGTVKLLTMEEVESTGAQIVLANTYHLWLRPTAEVVRTLGGLHRFTRWPRAMLTDSGGFQVFSLANLREVDDDGVTFRSHLDGTKVRLTPEESIRVQALLGADIAMAFDECPPGQSDRPTVERAMRRTTAWARRCLETPRGEAQALFGIVQGATFEDLRLSHLDEIAAMPFDGVAMGGFSVGEPVETMYALLGTIAHRMPDDRPRYLMGVGTARDLIHGALAGIDLFDCVLPTRNARNGQALTWQGRVNIKQLRNRTDDGPIDPACDGSCCTTGYSRGYLRHLYIANEGLVARVLSLHNLHFLGAVMRGVRAAIRGGRLEEWGRGVLAKMAELDEVGPADAEAS